MKYTQEKRLKITYEIDVRVGDVFRDHMRGWELHVKQVLDDNNLLIWREYRSEQKHRPLEERTDNLSVMTLESAHYCRAHLRGGVYSEDDEGAYATRGYEILCPTPAQVVSAEVV